MKITAIKTPIVKKNDDLFKIITDNIAEIPERSVLVIASKIVSYSQGLLVQKNSNSDSVSKSQKHQLVRREADKYLPPDNSKYNLMLTIKNNNLVINAGIDESNADNNFILWPRDLQQVVNDIWQFVREKYSLKEFGITISDSKTIPLRSGVVGTCLTHCGFKALRNYIGSKDLFGYTMKMEQSNVAEAITVAAVLESGEGNESKPLCLVSDISDIKFQNRIPNEKELSELIIPFEDDVYYPVLKSVDWRE